MNYELKIDQLLQASVHQLQMLSSKISQSTVGQLTGRAIIHLRKNSLNEYLQNNLGSVPRVILIANLGAAIFSSLIVSKVKNSDQSPQEQANQGIKIFTATALVVNTGLHLFTNFPANPLWIIGLTLAQTIAAAFFLKNREIKETQIRLECSEKKYNNCLTKSIKNNENSQKIHQEEKQNLQTDLHSKNKSIIEITDQLEKSKKEFEDLLTKSKEYEESLKNSYPHMENKIKQIENLNNQVLEGTSEINRLKQELEACQIKISNQQTEIENKDQHYKPQISHLVQDNKKLNNQIAELTSNLTEARQKIKNLHAQPDFQKNEIEKLKKQVTELTSKIEKPSGRSNNFKK